VDSICAQSKVCNQWYITFFIASESATHLKQAHQTYFDKYEHLYKSHVHVHCFLKFEIFCLTEKTRGGTYIFGSMKVVCLS
jgi:hypothetical protein